MIEAKEGTFTKIKCIVCKKEKMHLTRRIKVGLGKFCSRECSRVYQKGRKNPHSKEWEEKRLKAVRESAKNRIWPRGFKRPKEHTQPMLDALKKKMIENPEKYRQIAIRNLSKNKDGNLSKEGSPMWKGGITQEWQKWKSSHGKEFEKWRKVVYGRDGNKCKLCGSVKKLEAHHIIPIAENRSTAFLPMNGILLCHECHKKTSNFGGKIKRPTVTSSGKIRMICITIPHNFQIYETCGNYEWTDDGILVIFVSEMENKKYEFLVFLHEIIEATLCKDRGITTESITTFDMEYEKNRKQGDESEPGDNPLAPYQREHQFASTIEKKMSEQFSVSWKDYEETINSL